MIFSKKQIREPYLKYKEKEVYLCDKEFKYQFALLIMKQYFYRYRRVIINEKSGIGNGSGSNNLYIFIMWTRKELRRRTNKCKEQYYADLYEGVYSDYDVNEPSLEIKRNNDGSYQIQIKIYRLFYIDDGMGKVTEEGIEFVATGSGGNEVNGVIKLEEDIATVSFFNQEWIDFAGLSEYKFYKTSDAPDIYMYE